jgi:leucyl-tRNA synthetase
LNLNRDIDEEKVFQEIIKDKNISKYISDKKINKKIFIPNKLINIIV